MRHSAQARTVHYLAFALIAIGLAVRLGYAIAGHSLWLDELKLALNIQSRDLKELFLPLDHGQGAPPLFLVLLKIAWLYLGSSDTALLLPVYLAALLVLPTFYRTATSLLPKGAAVFALLLLLLNPQAFTYSFFLKQYIVDMLVTILLLQLFFQALNQDTEPPLLKDYLQLLAAGVFATWFSHASLFVLAGAGSVLWLHELLVRRLRNLVAYSTAILAWIASFTLQYVLVLQNLHANDSLRAYWEDAYFDPQTGIAGYLSWSGTMLGNLLHIATVPKLLAVPLLLLALYFSIREKRPKELMLWAIIVCAICASMLGLYPLSDRLSLFLVPIVLLLVSTGYHECLHRLQKHSAPALSIGFIALCSLAALLAVGKQFSHPARFQKLKEVFEETVQRAAHNNKVMITGDATTAYHFYAESTGMDELDVSLEPTSHILEYLPQIDAQQPPIALIWGRSYKHGTPTDYSAFFLALKQRGFHYTLHEKRRAYVLFIDPSDK